MLLTEKDVYHVSSEALRARKSRNEQYDKCNCTPCGGCQNDCINAVAGIDCTTDICSIGSSFCKNRLSERLPKRVETIFEICDTEKRGWGLRTKQDFNTGQAIAEYVGEVISKREFQKRCKLRKDDQNFYFMSLGHGLIIDATWAGSLTRFINHSCEPNTVAIKREIFGNVRVIFVIGNYGIAAGEELTFDYKLSSTYDCRRSCRCGAKSCRGYL